MEQKENNPEMEIDLGELLAVLLDKWLIILLTGIITAMAAFGISKFILPPVYESTTAVYVINKQESSATVTLSDLQTGTQLTKDYVALVESRTVIEQVIQEMNLNTGYEQFKGNLSVESPTDTRMLYITVQSYDPYEAMEIADKVREVAAEHIAAVMDIEAINVAERANLPTGPSSPSIKKWTAVGGLLGIFLSAGITLLLFLINDSIKTPGDIERYLGISTLGSIPLSEEIAEGTKRGRKKQSKGKNNRRERDTHAGNNNK